MKRVLIIAATLQLMLLVACRPINDERIPPAPVYIPFITEENWTRSGVTEAYQTREFIKNELKPSNYTYSALSSTGFGGVLLASDYNGNPVAYDLACPVECRPDIRIQVDPVTHIARCPKCHSEYEVCTLNYGLPIAGPAATYSYWLRRYSVGPGPQGEYRAIRN